MSLEAVTQLELSSLSCRPMSSSANSSQAMPPAESNSVILSIDSISQGCLFIYGFKEESFRVSLIAERTLSHTRLAPPVFPPRPDFPRPQDRFRPTPHHSITWLVVQSSMATNPYPRPKEHIALVTECDPTQELQEASPGRSQGVWRWP
jgi:hypothetical protein